MESQLVSGSIVIGCGVRGEDRARARYDIVRTIVRDIIKSNTIADLLHL